MYVKSISSREGTLRELQQKTRSSLLEISKNVTIYEFLKSMLQFRSWWTFTTESMEENLGDEI